MHIISHGAAQEVTGTCHEIEANGRRILLDCGLFQGKRSEAARKNESFAFNPGKDVDAVILSHAHMDHAGRIPLLWKNGYRKKVYCTYATKDLAAVMLKDAGYIQEKDEEYFCKKLAASRIQCEGPLYTQAHAEACMELFEGKNYGDWFPACPGIDAVFLDAGHILGAAMIVLKIREEDAETYIGFSGDLGRSSLPIIHDPMSMSPVSVLLCESTYGNRRHEPAESARKRLQHVIVATAKRGGKIIIPAFSLERTQEIVYDLHALWDGKKIPAIPIVIDSPLASKVTDVFMRHPECFDSAMYKEFLSRRHNPFQFSLVRHAETTEESKALASTPGPMIIMAGSGMCEAGRIRHHLKNEIGDPRNTILAVGYMAANTLGSRIVDSSVHQVKIFDQMYPKKAQIEYIDAYSGHADMEDLDAYVGKVQGLKNVVLVHGDPEQMEPFGKRLQSTLGVEVLMPERGQEIVIT